MSGPQDGELTRNEVMVLDALSRAAAPMSAYALLDALRADGFRAPMQVYRALDKLVARRRVHRLETLNAYVACAHRHGHAGTVLFVICNGCGEVAELADAELDALLRRRAQDRRFATESAIVELRGTCARCAEA